MSKAFTIWLFGAGPLAAKLLVKINKENGFKVLGVTPRKKPANRVGLDLAILDRAAKKNGLPLHSIKDVNDKKFIQHLRGLKIDLLVNWGYHQLFSRRLLNATRLGCLNLHPGLLPYGRGSGAVVGEILNGRRVIGQTLHLMSEEFDAREIISTRHFSLRGDEYQDEVNQMLEKGAVEFFLDGIRKLKSGCVGQKVRGFGTYYPKLKPGDEIIDWSMSSRFILDKVRARSK